jgi:hypothetical protein
MRCGSEHENIGGIEVQDYVPHHDPFQFYASTANPQHLPPTSEAAIGLVSHTLSDSLDGPGGLFTSRAARTTTRSC